MFSVLNFINIIIYINFKNNNIYYKYCYLLYNSLIRICLSMKMILTPNNI